MRVGEVNFGGVWLSSSRSIDLSRLEVDNVLECLRLFSVMLAMLRRLKGLDCG